MDKSNQINEERDRILQRIDELTQKDNMWHGKGDMIPGSTLTMEEQQELTQLQEKLKQLNKEDDETLGIK